MKVIYCKACGKRVNKDNGEIYAGHWYCKECEIELLKRKINTLTAQIENSTEYEPRFIRRDCCEMSYYRVRCGKCGAELGASRKQVNTVKYCPECGAKQKLIYKEKHYDGENRNEKV